MNLIFLKSYLEKAIKEQAYLKIDYVDRKMKITKDRTIKPLILKEDGTLISEDKDGVKNFVLEGIQKIERINEENKSL
ncbi:hypothetical protein M0R04_12500 [Candidatus Dojkabacteria bacterium]|jgi:predicted DNA-binding transcriptional regulator YafY|nr:hypothetical protein [Candidatus Dojkabacteria bacterium]